MFSFLKSKRAFLIIMLYLIPWGVFAVTNSYEPTRSPRVEGLGLVANNMLEPVGVLTNFVHAGCIIIGGSFVFASVIKYFEHRRSPLMVSISTVIFLFIAGAVLLLLPFLANVAD